MASLSVSKLQQTPQSYASAQLKTANSVHTGSADTVQGLYKLAGE